MNVLYLELNAGISGDMFVSALIDLGLDIRYLKRELEKLNLKKQFEIQIKETKVNGIACKQFCVHEDTGIERSFKQIVEIINTSNLSSEVKTLVKKLFKKLHKAEEKIHKESRHFHELGLLDTIIDIVSVVTGLKLLKIDKIYASKVNIGSGFVKTRHGLLPVPAPATAELLKGMPVYSFGPEGELVTPTGALLLGEFVTDFSMPEFKVEKIGYGAGHKKFKDFPNFLRGSIGKVKKESNQKALIETNIDDMNPQIYEYVSERLFSAGALDVYLTPVYMKKNRPGNIFSCICNKKDEEKMLQIIFEETTTIGVRISYPKRIELEREAMNIETPYGKIPVKAGRYNGNIANISPEYDDCKKIAKKQGIPLKRIMSTFKINCNLQA